MKLAFKFPSSFYSLWINFIILKYQTISIVFSLEYIILPDTFGCKLFLVFIFFNFKYLFKKMGKLILLCKMPLILFLVLKCRTEKCCPEIFYLREFFLVSTNTKFQLRTILLYSNILSQMSLSYFVHRISTLCYFSN